MSKHLVFAFQPTDRVFGHTLYAYPLDHHAAFAVLQSRIHEPWARLLSSSMRNDLRYSASDCFETFPFPQPDPRTVIPELEDLGQRLYDARAAYMLETQQGLTKTYNQLKDPSCTEPRILELRYLHEAMDSAVLRAYGWTDLAVPPYCPLTEADKRALETFETKVIDHLFVLNEQRAEQERLAGAAAASAGKQKKTKPAGKKQRGSGPGQGELGF